MSYSRADAAAVGPDLADRCAAGVPSYRLWVDVRDLDAGYDWDDQIEDAIKGSSGLFFVMTADSVRRESGCKNEWSWALKCKKPVIPLRFDAQAELPFRLSSRQYIDFTDGFGPGLARLRIYLGEMSEPKGQLRELRFRLADAQRELPRTLDPGHRIRVEQDIADLQRQVAALEGVAADPAAAVAQTDRRIETALEQVREPVKSAQAVPARARFVNPPPATAPAYFQDRHVESELLAGFLREPDVRLVTVVGRGGVGKTAMVCRLMKGLESGQLPDDLGPMDVDGIVYLRTPSAHPVSFASLFTDLCRLLPSEVADQLERRYLDPHETPGVLMSALLEAFPAEQRVVVLLDNFEDLLDESGGITDTALDGGLQAVLSGPAHGVTVVVTTRVAPRSLLLFQPAGQRRIDLDDGLSSPFAEAVLRARDPDGRLGLRDATDAVLGVVRERTRGYPRALEAVAAILSADRDTDLTELLAQTERLPENVVHALVGEAFERLDPLAQQVMQALAIFPVPVPPVAVDYLLQPFLPVVDAAPVLARLVNMQFVRRDAGRYFLHQVDRDYALGRVPAGEPSDRDEFPGPFTVYALRDQAADYFAQVQTPRQEWRTLDDLAAQLAEFELRCQGEDFDTAGELLLTIDFEYLITWGHYRYVIDLHTRLHGHLTDLWIRGSSVNNLGTCFYNLGEYQRAIDLYEEALELFREGGERDGEAASLGNLGNCYGELGQTARSIDFYEQALAIARDTGNRTREAVQLGNLGNRYADMGQTDRAIELYEEALAIARETGERTTEAFQLGNLGNRYAERGETDRAIELYEEALALFRDLGDRSTEATHMGNLASAFADLGEAQHAFELSEQALAIAREIGDRSTEAHLLGNLGTRYADLGETQRALELSEQALELAREIGNRFTEANQLGNLGNRYAELGQTERAIESYEEALDIAREISNRFVEAGQLLNLGNRYADLGQNERAVELYEESLAIAREIGDRTSEAFDLNNLGRVLGELGRLDEAVATLREAVEVGGTLGNGQAQAEARVDLAWVLLYAGDVPAAADVAQAAGGRTSPLASAGAALVTGVIELRQGAARAAEESFQDALARTDERLQTSPHDVDTLHERALALAGLTLTGPVGHVAESAAAMKAARATTTAPGIVSRARAQLDTLTPCDPDGALREVRSALEGDD